MNWQSYLKLSSPVIAFLAGCGMTYYAVPYLTDNPAMVGKAVNWYCAEIEPEQRSSLRAAVNEAASPHSVAISCDDSL